MATDFSRGGRVTGRNGWGRRGTVAATVWLCVAACGSGAQDPGTGSAGAEASEEADRRAITEASRAFSAAYVAGDTASIRDLYTDDAVLLPPGGEVRGRDAIVRYFAPGPRRVNEAHAMTSSELRIDGDRAVDLGTWSNTWRIGGGEPSRAEERYLVVWRRGADGRWRIEIDMWHRPG